MPVSHAVEVAAEGAPVSDALSEAGSDLPMLTRIVRVGRADGVNQTKWWPRAESNLAG